MRDRKVNTQKGGASATCNERVSVELTRSEVELLKFLRGQKHQPDQEVQLDMLVSMVQLVMDDQLLHALKETEQTYLYWNEMSVDGVSLKQVWPQRQLIMELETYQKSRLRDALEAQLGPSLS